MQVNLNNEQADRNNKIRGKHYFTVTDVAGRKAIESLAAKLRLLERDILNYPQAISKLIRKAQLQ